MNINNSRLIDVFLSGPLQILVSSYIARPSILRYYMLLTGILNILYNGHSFLFFNSTIKQPLPLFKPFIHLKNGKTQLHRFYNLMIMYPTFIVVLLTVDMPLVVKVLFLINIIIGFSYNLYYYLSIYKSL
jgi:hypothetical protein